MSLRRLAPIALAALAACTETDTSTCPGQAVGRFDFALALSSGAVVGGETVVSGCVPRDDVPAGTFTPPEPGLGGTRASFLATVADEGLTGAALCTGERFADPRFGTRAGDAYVFDDASWEPADLGACGPRCPVRLVEKVGGALCGPGHGACPEPASGGLEFRGWVVDEFDVPEDAPGEDTYDCGTCRGTCRAVYDLAGTAVVP
jgi:hypothetical protein